MDNVIAVVLGGGRGSRLFPLTQYRSKPAVPVAASYRLVDVAVSNCIHAGLRRIFVITQYQSESLNRHVANTYKFDAFPPGFIDVLAAEQTDGENDWFRGTADAVRKCMKHIGRESWNTLAILSGDQLYRMNLREMLRVHAETKAACTVATKPVPAELTSGSGIMKTDPSGRVTHFDEKPPPERLPQLGSQVPGMDGPIFLASMGIYVFDRRELEVALSDPSGIDFGKHVLPSRLSEARIQTFLHHDYWEDVGTVRSFYEANLALTRPRPEFSFYHPHYPIYSQRPFLAPTKMRACRIDDALVADGCLIEEAEIQRAVIGIRTRVAPGTSIRNSLILGADEYDALSEGVDPAGRSVPPVGIGEGSVIDNAIVDKNARIGRGVRIQNARNLKDHDGGFFFVRDGIVIIPKGAVVPDGTHI